MTKQTGKTAREQLEELIEQERQQELHTLADTIAQATHGKFRIEVSSHVVWLYVEKDIIVSVVSMRNWEQLLNFASIINSPSDADLQDMEYQAQESNESRRNGYGAE